MTTTDSPGPVQVSEEAQVETGQTNISRDVRPLSLIRASAIFASGNLTATAIRLISGVLVSRLVAPSVLGLYNGIGLVRGYAPFMQAGVSNGLNRDLPYLVGKGEKEKARELVAVAHGWLLFVSVLASCGLLGAAGWYAWHGRYELSIGWASFVIPVVGVLYGQFYMQILYRTHGKFPRLSFITILNAVTGLITVAFVWWLGFGGLCLRGIVISGVALFLLWRWLPLSVRPRWRWPTFKLLLATGIPIYLVGQLSAWWVVFDSTLVLKYMGPRGLGLYAIATLASGTVLLLPRALNQVVYPSMAEAYGRSPHIKPLVSMVIMPTLVNLVATSSIVAVSWVLLPFAVSYILPKYTGGIAAAQWMILNAIVMAMTPINSIFNVVKKQGRYGMAIVSGMGIYYGVLLWRTRGGPTLQAFPQAMVIGRIAFLVICYGLVAQMYLSEQRRTGS